MLSNHFMYLRIFDLSKWVRAGLCAATHSPKSIKPFAEWIFNCNNWLWATNNQSNGNYCADWISFPGLSEALCMQPFWFTRAHKQRTKSKSERFSSTSTSTSNCICERHIVNDIMLHYLGISFRLIIGQQIWYLYNWYANTSFFSYVSIMLVTNKKQHQLLLRAYGSYELKMIQCELMAVKQLVGRPS